MSHRSLFLTTAMVTAFLAVGSAAPVSLATEAPRPARLEKIPGSDIPKVVLLEAAAKRLGIQTADVREEEAKSWKIAVGEVEKIAGDLMTVASLGNAPATEGNGAPDVSQVWIKVRMSDEGTADSQQLRLVIRRGETHVGENIGEDESDLFDDIDSVDGSDIQDANDVTDDDPGDATKVVIIPFDRKSAAKRYSARLIKVATNTQSDPQYYDPVEPDAGLVPGERVFVRMIHPNNSTTVRTVPYSSVIYKDDGSAWLYVNTGPLEFMRQKILIDRILDDTVILSDGPPAGTMIVSVGAAELMGVEQKIGH